MSAGFLNKIEISTWTPRWPFWSIHAKFRRLTAQRDRSLKTRDRSLKTRDPAYRAKMYFHVLFHQKKLYAQYCFLAFSISIPRQRRPCSDFCMRPCICLRFHSYCCTRFHTWTFPSHSNTGRMHRELLALRHQHHGQGCRAAHRSELGLDEGRHIYCCSSGLWSSHCPAGRSRQRERQTERRCKAC